jgi:hypothetical protein
METHTHSGPHIRGDVAEEYVRGQRDDGIVRVCQIVGELLLRVTGDQPPNRKGSHQ